MCAANPVGDWKRSEQHAVQAMVPPARIRPVAGAFPPPSLTVTVAPTGKLPSATMAAAFFRDAKTAILLRMGLFEKPNGHITRGCITYKLFF